MKIFLSIIVSLTLVCSFGGVTSPVEAAVSCNFPSSVAETFSYNPVTDLVSVTENFASNQLCSDAISSFAPLPPVLALAKDTLPIVFSGTVVDLNLPTTLGPTMGIRNVSSYTWSISGLGKYTDAIRESGTENVPPELDQELAAEVNKITPLGHLAPWIFIDYQLMNQSRGDLYWANPADILYHLVEIAEALPDGTTKTNLINYIKTERASYPPEDVYNLDIFGGRMRKSFTFTNDPIDYYWKSCGDCRGDVLYKRVSLYNFYGLSRYYEFTNERVPPPVLAKAKNTLSQDVQNQDWATMYWTSGNDKFFANSVAVTNASRYFAGLVGFIKLAKAAGDTASDTQARGYLAKAAVLRIALTKYPRYLYASGLFTAPPDPKWYVKGTGLSSSGYDWGLYGHLYNYNWLGPYDDHRQVFTYNRSNVTLEDSTNLVAFGSSYLIGYRDLVPVTARLLSDFVKQESLIYANKYTTLEPSWYAAYQDALVGVEHNLTYPIDSFQTFLAKAWIGNDTPDHLRKYRDISWLEEGDLFYMQKLAETIKAYRGDKWHDAAGISIDQSSSTPTARYTDMLTFTISIGYTGGTITQTIPITMTDQLPAGLSYTGGLCNSSLGGPLVCSPSSISWYGQLSPGNDSVDLTYAVNITVETPKALKNTVQVDAGSYGTPLSTVIIVANPYNVCLPIIRKVD